VIRVTLLRILGEVGGDGTGQAPAGPPYGAADESRPCRQNQRFAQIIALCAEAGATISFPAVFFAAIIGVIIFIALSAVLLEPRE
jgi:hypothetical protein